MVVLNVEERGRLERGGDVAVTLGEPVEHRAGGLRPALPGERGRLQQPVGDAGKRRRHHDPFAFLPGDDRRRAHDRLRVRDRRPAELQDHHFPCPAGPRHTANRPLK